MTKRKPARARKLPPDQVVKRLYSEGHSQREIAQRYGVSRQAVARTLERLGVQCRPAHSGRRFTDPEQESIAKSVLAHAFAEQLTDGEVKPEDLEPFDWQAFYLGATKEEVAQLLIEPRFKRQLDRLRSELIRRNQSVMTGIRLEIAEQRSFALIMSDKASARERTTALSNLATATKNYGGLHLSADLTDHSDVELAEGAMRVLDADGPRADLIRELCPNFVRALKRRRKVSCVGSEDADAPDASEFTEFLSVPEHRRIFEDWRREQEADRS